MKKQRVKIKRKKGVSEKSVTTFGDEKIFEAFTRYLFRQFVMAVIKKKPQREDNKKSKDAIEENVVVQSNNKDVKAAFKKAEEKIGRALNESVDSDDDEDEADNLKSSYPNLKYRKPKYKNIESILKYVETPDDKGGVKLVIMNFND